jgi:hypothetical protein
MAKAKAAKGHKTIHDLPQADTGIMPEADTGIKTEADTGIKTKQEGVPDNASNYRWLDTWNAERRNRRNVVASNETHRGQNAY